MTSAGPNSRFLAHKYGFRSAETGGNVRQIGQIFKHHLRASHHWDTTHMTRLLMTQYCTDLSRRAPHRAKPVTQKCRARSMHRASTGPQQRAVQRHTSSRKALHMAARAATTRERHCAAVAQSCTRRHQSCRLPPRCQGAWYLRATRCARCKHTRDARLHRGCCNHCTPPR